MNARECDVIKRKANTCEVDAYLYPALNSTKRTPLQIYNEFSRFKITVIENGVTSATVNIPVDDIYAVLKNSNEAFIKEKGFEKTDNAPDSIAYTTRFALGQLKGKSPADVLLEQGKDGVKVLEKQYMFLESNADKYPKNKEFMAAIEEAVIMFKNGQLEAVHNTSEILYNIPIKVLENRKNKSGKSFVYSVQIRWEFGQMSPVVVSIKNYYAYTDNKGGLVNPKTGTEENIIYQTFRIAANDWIRICERIKENMEIFRLKYGVALVDEAERLDNENRIKAGYKPY